MGSLWILNVEIFTKVNAMLCAIRDLPLKAKRSENVKEMEMICTGLVTQSAKVRLARIHPAIFFNQSKLHSHGRSDNFDWINFYPIYFLILMKWAKKLTPRMTSLLAPFCRRLFAFTSMELLSVLIPLLTGMLGHWIILSSRNSSILWI